MTALTPPPPALATTREGLRSLACYVISPARKARTGRIGFSPGDGWLAEPYIYVGPHDTTGLTDAYWNAPFGSVLTHAALRTAADPDAACADFIDEGLRLVASRPR